MKADVGIDGRSQAQRDDAEPGIVFLHAALILVHPNLWLLP
jgi:hypothetical protein